MSFSKQIFGKELRDLQYVDVEIYFNAPQAENDTLEFKSDPGKGGTLEQKLGGIFKSVCAFANSSGGLLIWGAPVGIAPAAPAKEKIFQGSLTVVDPSIEKDYLVSRISSKLIPLFGTFNVEILKNATGDKIAVIEIEQSTYAPHQYDGIYYMRLDGQSRPAPHHYIEALFKRISYPNLEGYLKFGEIGSFEVPTSAVISPVHKVKYVVEVTIYIFNYSPLQNEENIFFTLHTDTTTSIKNFLPGPQPTGNFLYNKNSFTNKNAQATLTYGSPYVHSEIFEIDPHLVAQKGNIVTFGLYFGGKKSPFKYSVYKINVTDFRNQPDTNKLIVEVKENQFVHDYVAQQGITKESQLKNILGR